MDFLDFLVFLALASALGASALAAGAAAGAAWVAGAAGAAGLACAKAVALDAENAIATKVATSLFMDIPLKSLNLATGKKLLCHSQ